MNKRQKLKARGKVTQKLTRDGLIERNAATGEEVRISKRLADFDLRGESADEALSQIATRPSGKQPGKHKKRAVYREAAAQNKQATNVSETAQSLSPLQFKATETEKSQPLQFTAAETAKATNADADSVASDPTNQDAVQHDIEQPIETEAPDIPHKDGHTPPQNKHDVFRRPPRAKTKPPPNRKPQYRFSKEHPADITRPDAVQNPVHVVGNVTPVVTETAPPQSATPPIPPADIPKSQLQTEKPGRLKFERDAKTEPPPKGKTHNRRTRDAPSNVENGTTPDVPSERVIVPAPSKDMVERSVTDKPLHEEKPSKLRFDSEEPVPPPIEKPKRYKSADAAVKPETETVIPDTPKAETTDSSGTFPHPVDAGGTSSLREKSEPTLKSDESGAPLKSERTSKLKFSADETAEVSPDPAEAPKPTRNRKLGKAQKQADKAVTKLENAKAKLPAKKKLRSERVFNEETGKPKRRLYFENEVKSQAEHLKGAKPLRPVKIAGNTAIAFGHRKMFQVERENVATEAAHKGEMAAEGVVRSALRHRKLAPYRKVTKLEQTAAKKSVNLAYQKALAENPKLQSNIISRAFQKRKIKKDYAKAAREAQKAVNKAKKAGSAVGNAVKAVAGAVTRHPIAAAVIVLILLLLFALMSLIGAFGSMGGGSVGGILSSSYLSEDADILGAEAAYAAMETDLQNELDNYERLHPGYDEYVFDLDEIWHDPYVLTSIISALHEGAWTLDEVQDTLAMLFERQYILTETVTSEVRYRTETRIEIDPVTGAVYEFSVQVPYDYYICTMTLENFDLSHLPIYIMSEAELSSYALYTATLGNRPDLFPTSLYPNASYYKDYGRHEIPPEYFGDATFAAIISEAEKYCGMPYVWGGYSPATSFDCSGFVSYVLNQCGWDIGRLGAHGLYNISATVSASEAKPGDLAFFTGTYDTPGMSHVGIYVGDGMMLHCGDPIGYVSIETSYWQAHFQSFGRLYN